MMGSVHYIPMSPDAGLRLADRVLRHPDADPESVAAAVEVFAQSPEPDHRLRADMLRRAPPVTTVPIRASLPAAEERDGLSLAVGAVLLGVLVGLAVGHWMTEAFTKINEQRLEVTQ